LAAGVVGGALALAQRALAWRGGRWTSVSLAPWRGLLVVVMATAAVYLTYTYYRAVMPRDIVDAAKVDGCSDLAMFWYIGLPLARSVIAMLLFTQFSLLWNGFFAASIFLERDQYKTLPVGIAVMAQQTGALNPNPTASANAWMEASSPVRKCHPSSAPGRSSMAR